MKKFFKPASLVLSLVLVASPTAFASGKSVTSSNYSLETNAQNAKIAGSQIVREIKGKQFNFNVKPSAQGKVSEKALQAIAEQAAIIETGSVNINIENVVEAKNFSQSTHQSATITQVKSNEEVHTNAWYDLSVNWDPTIKYVSSRDNAGPAQFIISVARGQKIQLTSSKTMEQAATVSFEAGAPMEKINGNITQKISQTYSTSISWEGPNEPYISRMFYWTGFRDYGTYSIRGYGNISGDLYGPYTGSYYEPTYYVQWSQDIK